jgi:hypothetical protein
MRALEKELAEAKRSLGGTTSEHMELLAAVDRAYDDLGVPRRRGRVTSRLV